MNIFNFKKIDKNKAIEIAKYSIIQVDQKKNQKPTNLGRNDTFFFDIYPVYMGNNREKYYRESLLIFFREEYVKMFLTENLDQF